jgi:Zn-dependent protease
VDGVGTDQPQVPPTYGPPPPPERPLAAPKPLLKRILGPIAAVGAAIVKWGAILLKLKVFTLAGTMLLSLAAYAWIWGWTFALGFILLLFIHEMGHVIALRRMGIKAGLPTFIPFLGAFVTMKEQPKTAWHEAVSGIAGPVLGSAAAALCWWYAHETGSNFVRALAFAGFLINLFNLIPILPLDGGRTAAAIHPALWVVGLAGLLVLEVYRPTPIIPIILIFGGIEAWRRYKGRATAESRAYYALSADQRRIMSFTYLALVVLLVFAVHGTYVHRTFN